MRKAIDIMIRTRFPFLLPILLPITSMLFKRKYSHSSNESIFTDIFNTNLWGSNESRSGQGSELVQTKILREHLPKLLTELKVKSLLDIPCGDFNWLKEVDLSFLSYVGADIVEELIRYNNENYNFKNIKFLKLDIINDNLPKVDLILCRDLFIHFSYKDIFKSLDNIKKSGCKYLLTTSYPSTKKNIDILTGRWHYLNLLIPPFSFPKPMRIIDEESSEKGIKNKNLLLWNISDL